jgi:Zn-dependent M28 family amino/carboxypeptidase
MGPSSRRKPFRRKTGWAAGALAATALLCWGAWSLTQQNPAIGTAALEHVKALVALGPRPSGSEAHREMQRYITRQLEVAGAAVEQIPFVAQTPIGPVSMNNIVGRITHSAGGGGGRIFVLATHYDTKRETGFRFVGANDGGSSTGLLLALAPLLAKRALDHEIWLVFFDGEEAFEQWSESDSLYGSRHLAAKWKTEGVLPRIGAFLLVDMIGDSDLDLLRDTNSTPWLRDQAWKVAQRLGYSRHFLNQDGAYEDDHLPFVRAGVPAVDLIDLNYGPGGRYWHSPEDTLDKLSARSLQIVGEVLLETLFELDRQH